MGFYENLITKAVARLHIRAAESKGIVDPNNVSDARVCQSIRESIQKKDWADVIHLAHVMQFRRANELTRKRVRKSRAKNPVPEELAKVMEYCA